MHAYVDAAVGAPAEVPRMTYVSGLPFGRNGDEVVVSIGGAGLYFRTVAAATPGMAQGKHDWTYRIDVSDVQEVSYEPLAKRGGLLGFLGRKKSDPGPDTPARLTIKAAFVHGRTQTVELHAPLSCIEKLVADLQARREFYRHKRVKEVSWAWRD